MTQAGRTAFRAAAAAFRAFRRDNAQFMAAAISYHAVFSLFPLLAVLIAVLGLVLRDEELRQDLVERIVEAVPVSDEGSADLESLLDGIAGGNSTFGFVGLVGLLWSAGAVMGAVRAAFTTVFGTSGRAFVHGKLLDLALVASAALLLATSFGLSVATQAVRRLGEGVADALGPLGGGAGAAVWLLGVAAPLTVSTATFLFLYRAVPARTVPVRPALTAALLAAICFELLKAGFSFYLSNFGRYDVVYGSLGAALAFLFFIYLSSNVLLLGAELAATLAGPAEEPEAPGEPEEPQRPEDLEAR